MADVQLGRVKIKDMRHVTVSLGTETLVHAGNGGGRFRPDQLRLSYENGVLTMAVLSGPKIRADKREYLDGQRGSRIFTVSGENTNTPEWVNELASRYQPT